MFTAGVQSPFVVDLTPPSVSVEGLPKFDLQVLPVLIDSGSRVPFMNTHLLNTTLDHIHDSSAVTRLLVRTDDGWLIFLHWNTLIMVSHHPA